MLCLWLFSTNFIQICPVIRGFSHNIIIRILSHGTYKILFNGISIICQTSILYILISILQCLKMRISPQNMLIKASNNNNCTIPTLQIIIIALSLPYKFPSIFLSVCNFSLWVCVITCVKITISYNKNVKISPNYSKSSPIWIASQIMNWA